MSKSEDEYFLEQVASKIQHQLTLHEHIFAIGTLGQTATPTVSSLIIMSSNLDFVQRAVLLASSKFLGRILGAHMVEERWIATIQDLGVSPFDEDALWDVLAKASRTPMDPLMPPPGSMSINEMLEHARAKLQRITPMQAYDELRESQVGAPTFLVDIRPQAQREREGAIHGSLIIERNVLEWRFDPRSEARLAIADRYDLRIIIFCQEGYTSSLAAYSLQQLGLLNATDIIGGYAAWSEAELPVDSDRRSETHTQESRSLVSLAGSVV
ncbi:hypothetical protein CPB83DRAFT_864151 [Crepidotus variabilis]|uniref:Rhodanese domain-containing protein n=1 Tax=Crepidotus variabilis TaxID=179855 RepID=A0A9P6JJ32_9AGAR|nr:hypothetical protein CPB83DRAFT_864151 [Crepidotus variabilis]